jgi:hypothetical protein
LPVCFYPPIRMPLLTRRRRVIAHLIEMLRTRL